MADVQILTTTWKATKHKSSVCRHFVWHTSSKLLILISPTLDSERSYVCVSRHSLKKCFKSSDCSL